MMSKDVIILPPLLLCFAVFGSSLPTGSSLLATSQNNSTSPNHSIKLRLGSTNFNEAVKEATLNSSDYVINEEVIKNGTNINDDYNQIGENSSYLIINDTIKNGTEIEENIGGESGNNNKSGSGDDNEGGSDGGGDGGEVPDVPPAELPDLNEYNDILDIFCDEEIKLGTTNRVTVKTAVSYTHLTLPTICSV
eukprot:TRINITY_DN17696_c0_g1_i1.p1 TRINITY_DN17696_c0_g1~~TRINITY_DN17696_c0_g1_i1.p1  ORF type:complete len:193 (-),score=21.17 TRINITY_DN17696_c0_g1_i1:39-617(-)